MKFAINPPNTPLVGADGGPSPEWYRYFVQQRRQGDDITDSDVLTLGPAQEVYPNSRALEVQSGDLTRTVDNSSVTLGLAEAGTPGTYGDASKTVQITVDDKGRVTATVEFVLDTDNITEGLSNLFFTVQRARNSISGAGGRIDYSTATGIIDLEDGIVTPGSFTNANVTVDTYGRVTAASNGGGTTGFTGSGLFTNLTFVNGLCTAAS